MFNYTTHSGGSQWFDYHWHNITCAVNSVLNGLDLDTGLQNKTQPNEWARLPRKCWLELRIECLVLLRSHISCLHLQFDFPIPRLARFRRKIEESYNTYLWNPATTLYRGNTTTTLHQQDRNAFALLFNLTQTSSQQLRLVTLLKRNGANSDLLPQDFQTPSPLHLCCSLRR